VRLRRELSRTLSRTPAETLFFTYYITNCKIFTTLTCFFNSEMPDPPWLPNPDPEPSGRGGTGSPLKREGSRGLPRQGGSKLANNHRLSLSMFGFNTLGDFVVHPVKHSLYEFHWVHPVQISLERFDRVKNM
jgi:hypothetical protein